VDPFLEAIAASNALLNLDWKGSCFEQRVGELLEAYGLTERTLVSFENPESSHRLNAGHPSLTVGLSFSTEARPTDTNASAWLAKNVSTLLENCDVDALMLEHDLADEEVATAVRRAGAGLFLWTARDRETFDHLLRYGPDGIATDVIEDPIAGR
jgi:hypothetical protein